MALAKKRSNSTRTVVIIAVVAAVAGIGYVLFDQFFLKRNDAANSANASAHNTTVITNFGESILNDPRYTNLKSYDTTTNVDVNHDAGQSNPFR